MTRQPSELKFGIVGSGRLGTSLILALLEKSVISWVVVRSQESKARLSNFKNLKIFNSIDDLNDLPDVIVLAVSDSAIREVSDSVADHFKEKLSGKTVLHCSGSVSPDVLSECAHYGAVTGVAHPYQTFYYPSADLFSGIAWAVDTKSGFEESKRFVEFMGGKPFPFDLSDYTKRGIYHASAVIASNFMNILIEAGRTLLNNASLPESDFLAPILKTTIENNIRSLKENGEIPLTGPYARKDLKGIALHADSLKTMPDMKDIYCCLARSAVLTLKARGLIDEDTLTDILKLL